jgi:phage tail tube protein FII
MQTLLFVLLIALALWGVAWALVAPLAPQRDSAPAMFIKCLPFQNVVASGVATINFANLLGYTVEYIMLVLGGTALTKAMVTDIDIKANAKTIFKNSGARLDDSNEYRGETASANYLVIPFDESRSRTELRGAAVIDGEKIGSIDTTFGVQSLTGEVTITGATAPTLKAYAEVSAAPIVDERFRGLIAKTFNFTVSPAAAGTFLFDIPQGRANGSIVKRIQLHGATVTGYLVKKNGVTIQEIDATADITYQQQREGRVPQANVQVIDFIKDGNQSAALNAFDARSMEYYMTVSGAGNVVVVVELYDPLNNN